MSQDLENMEEKTDLWEASVYVYQDTSHLFPQIKMFNKYYTGPTCKVINDWQTGGYKFIQDSYDQNRCMKCLPCHQQLVGSIVKIHQHYNVYTYSWDLPKQTITKGQTFPVLSPETFTKNFGRWPSGFNLTSGLLKSKKSHYHWWILQIFDWAKHRKGQLVKVIL